MYNNVLNEEAGWFKTPDGTYIKVDDVTGEVEIYSGPVFPDTHVPEEPSN